MSLAVLTKDKATNRHPLPAHNGDHHGLFGKNGKVNRPRGQVDALMRREETTRKHATGKLRGAFRNHGKLHESIGKENRIPYLKGINDVPIRDGYPVTSAQHRRSRQDELIAGAQLDPWFRDGADTKFGTSQVLEDGNGCFEMIRKSAHQVYLFWCSSVVPWEKFNRATFIPSLMRAAMTSTESLVGPKVQTILVFLIPSIFLIDKKH